MPLVNYDYDSSDEESHEDNDKTSNDIQTKPMDSRVDSSSELSVDTTSNLFSRLPAPKSVPNTASLVANSSLSDIIVDKSKSGPIRISVPSLKYYSEEDNEDIEESKKWKRIKMSSTGTGLSALLPKPKYTTSTTSKSLIPQSLMRPKASTSSAAKRMQSSAKSRVEDKTSEESVNYFFNDEKSDDNIVAEDVLPLNDIEYGPKPLPLPATSDPDPTESLATRNRQTLPAEVNDMTYKKMIASKFGEEAAEDIDIIDIDVSKHLSDSKDWLKTITEEKEETYSGVQPTSTAKRKHQITFLALQAKQREVELKNEWANSRMNKTQSRAKYGF